MARLDQEVTSENISWSEVHKDARTLSEQLSQEMPFKGIIAVTRGGLVPASILARELKIKTIETVCVEAYREEETALKDGVNVLKEPTMAGDGTGWLMVDDLVDTGTTAKKVREMVPNATFVTLYAKPKGLDLVDLHIKTFPQDVWVFFPWDTQLQYIQPISAKE